MKSQKNFQQLVNCDISNKNFNGIQQFKSKSMNICTKGHLDGVKRNFINKEQTFKSQFVKQNSQLQFFKQNFLKFQAKLFNRQSIMTSNISVQYKFRGK